MSLENDVSFMLEVKEETELKIVKDFVEKLGYKLDDNYKVPMEQNKTVIYLIGGPKDKLNFVDQELRKQNWVHGVWSNPKMDSCGEQDWRC